MKPNHGLTTFRWTLDAYTAFCKPLCRELDMTQLAFDILMFLANNPECCTARDICLIRGFKENNVSINVNKLVNEGYLERQPIDHDRRKIRLVLTDKAMPIVERGRVLQVSFSEALLDNLTEQEKTVFSHCLQVVAKNARHMAEKR